MCDKINNKLDEIKDKIDYGEFLKESSLVEEWGGADVIIKKNLTDKKLTWLIDQPEVLSLQESDPRRRVVITEYSKELSWLFYKLRDTFEDRFNKISKYDFYGFLAQTAMNYLDENDNKVNCGELLNVVLFASRRFIKKDPKGSI